MFVGVTSEHMQTLQGVLGDGVTGHHAADGYAHSQLGLLSHHILVLGLLQAADPTGVGAVQLLIQLLAGQSGLAGVDKDDVIAAVSVGGEFRSVRAAKNFRSLNSTGSVG